MHQRLVIAVLIARAELQVRAEEQPDVVFPLGQHNSLVARVARKDHLIGVEIIIGRCGNIVGAGHAAAKQRQHGDTHRPQSKRTPDLIPEQKRCPQRDTRVDHPKQNRRPHQTKLRDQQQWKQQRCAQCPQIVESKDVRNQITKLETVFQYPHQQRNLQTHQRPDQQHQKI